MPALTLAFGKRACNSSASDCARAASTSNSVSDSRAHVQRRVRDRRAGAAGAQLHDAFQRHVRQAALKRARETGPVGVVTDTLAVLEQHGVDRAERAGVVGQFIEQRNHRLLARIGDVQAVVTHPFGRGQQLRQRGGIELLRIQIDASVHVMQTKFAALFLVHCGRERTADARTDQSDQKGLGRGPQTRLRIGQRGDLRVGPGIFLSVRLSVRLSVHLAALFLRIVAIRSSAST
ncbi:hypothetical protein OKW34_002106 [Paraburkholderia youngii]